MPQAVRDELSLVCTDIGGSFFVDVSHLWHWIKVVDVWQNFCDQTSDNLVLEESRRVVPRLEVLLFTRIKLHQWNREITGTCSESHQQCRIKHVVSPDPLSPTPSAMNTHKTQEITLMTLNRQQKRYKNGGLLWLVMQPKYRSSNKKLPVRT
jgi:hypothetical protein